MAEIKKINLGGVEYDLGKNSLQAKLIATARMAYSDESYIELSFVMSSENYSMENFYLIEVYNPIIDYTTMGIVKLYSQGSICVYSTDDNPVPCTIEMVDETLHIYSTIMDGSAELCAKNPSSNEDMYAKIYKL